MKKYSQKSEIFSQAWDEWEDKKNCLYSEAWARWWQDKRDNNNLHLSHAGLNHWIKVRKLRHWFVPFNGVVCNPGSLLGISRHIEGVYGFRKKRNIPNMHLVVFDDKTATTLCLYESVEKYLDLFDTKR